MRKTSGTLPVRGLLPGTLNDSAHKRGHKGKAAIHLHPSNRTCSLKGTPERNAWNVNATKPRVILNEVERAVSLRGRVTELKDLQYPVRLRAQRKHAYSKIIEISTDTNNSSPGTIGWQRVWLLASSSKRVACGQTCHSPSPSPITASF